MKQPQNLVIVGSNEETPAKFFTQLEPIKLSQNMGMAIKSIFHGSINNVTSDNNKILAQLEQVMGDISGNIPDRLIELEMEEGNYTSTLSIVKAIALQFKEEFGENPFRRRKPKLVKPVHPPYIEIDKSELDTNGNGYFTIKPHHMNLVFQPGLTPWSVFESRSFVLLNKETLRIKNVDYSKTIQPTFLYSNIVENSYINGKLSRNLSTIPLTMNSGWNFHEFRNPTYVPIDVKEFSKIIIELRDMDGKYIKFDPAFKTIINLHIKPINTEDLTEF